LPLLSIPESCHPGLSKWAKCEYHGGPFLSIKLIGQPGVLFLPRGPPANTGEGRIGEYLPKLKLDAQDDKEEEEDRLDEEDDDDERLSRQDERDDEEEDVQSDDMRATLL